MHNQQRSGFKLDPRVWPANHVAYASCRPQTKGFVLQYILQILGRDISHIAANGYQTETVARDSIDPTPRWLNEPCGLIAMPQLNLNAV